jgi:hypothetical protein
MDNKILKDIKRYLELSKKFTKLESEILPETIFENHYGIVNGNHVAGYEQLSGVTSTYGKIVGGTSPSIQGTSHSFIGGGTAPNISSTGFNIVGSPSSTDENLSGNTSYAFIIGGYSPTIYPSSDSIIGGRDEWVEKSKEYDEFRKLQFELIEYFKDE